MDNDALARFPQVLKRALQGLPAVVVQRGEGRVPTLNDFADAAGLALVEEFGRGDAARCSGEFRAWIGRTHREAQEAPSGPSAAMWGDALAGAGLAIGATKWRGALGRPGGTASDREADALDFFSHCFIERRFPVFLGRDGFRPDPLGPKDAARRLSGVRRPSRRARGLTERQTPVNRASPPLEQRKDYRPSEREAESAALEAEHAIAAVAAALSARRARQFRGKGRRAVIDNMESLMRDSLTLAELGRRVGLDESTLREAYKDELAALRAAIPDPE